MVCEWSKTIWWIPHWILLVFCQLLNENFQIIAKSTAKLTHGRNDEIQLQPIISIQRPISITPTICLPLHHYAHELWHGCKNSHAFKINVQRLAVLLSKSDCFKQYPLKQTAIVPNTSGFGTILQLKDSSDRNLYTSHLCVPRISTLAATNMSGLL